MLGMVTGKGDTCVFHLSVHMKNLFSLLTRSTCSAFLNKKYYELCPLYEVIEFLITSTYGRSSAFVVRVGEVPLRAKIGVNYVLSSYF